MTITVRQIPRFALLSFTTALVLGSTVAAAPVTSAKNVQQTEDNVRAADLPPLTPAQMKTVRDVYDRSIRSLVHHRW